MRGWWRITLVAALGMVGTACSDQTGASMQPGSDCLQCHSTSDAGTARTFTAAGTIYRTDGRGAPGVVVTLTDSATLQATAVTNSVGNFYFTEALTSPLRVELDDGAVVRTMARAAGACNSCHAEDGSARRPILLP